MLIIKYIILAILALNVEIALGQCKPDYASMNQAISALDHVTFPVDKFNTGCLSNDCSSLSDLQCPYNSDNSVNSAVYSEIVSSVQACLSQGKPICSTPIDPIPLCPLGVSLLKYLAPSQITGTLGIQPNSGTATGMSQTVLAYNPASSYFIVNIPSLVYQAEAHGDVGVVGSQQTFNFANVSVSSNINMSLILQVQTKPQLSVRVISKSITSSVDFGQLLTNSANGGPLNLLQTFLDQASQTAIQNSFIPNDVGNFLGIIIGNAIQIASQKCS